LIHRNLWLCFSYWCYLQVSFIVIYNLNKRRLFELNFWYFFISSQCLIFEPGLQIVWDDHGATPGSQTVTPFLHYNAAEANKVFNGHEYNHRWVLFITALSLMIGTSTPGLYILSLEGPRYGISIIKFVALYPRTWHEQQNICRYSHQL
jgi:hypothetical protein